MGLGRFWVEGRNDVSLGKVGRAEVQLRFEIQIVPAGRMFLDSEQLSLLHTSRTCL